MDCKNLTSINIPNNLTEIGGNAFYGCSMLTSIVIPDSVTTMGDWVFKGCNNLTDIKIPEKFKDEDTLKHLGFDDIQIDTILND
jgi:hypothetical protein